MATTINLTGQVDNVVVKRVRPFRAPGRQVMANWEWYAEVRVALDGKTLYFNTPRIKEYDNSFDKENTPFLAVEGSHVICKVRKGDTITVSGRVKADKVSKAGNPYISLTHVKLGKTVRPATLPSEAIQEEDEALANLNAMLANCDECDEPEAEFDPYLDMIMQG